ncbi:two-component system response regulator CreB [Luteimonas sp. MC1782]|uniref:two-component system response regulator CreB n=1 Tax=Luteimonas sp. MC1782 TaxID=2760305 RepID=UPI0016002E46|nr:two-component system response regulator CreB [Luteimonas sp. MC1782]MBB1472441.1 two-component system response regulator CreB [Luteimonas sp. MC1782]
MTADAATRSTVLLVEDDLAIAETILYPLRAEGFAVEHHLLGGGVAERVRAGGIDLVLLDVGLPDVGGFEVCRRLRAFSALPVVFLTARSDEFDRVLGLELGADDYIAKPFSPRELVARVRARLRRHPVADTDGGGVRRNGRFEHDPDARRIAFAGTQLELTRYEYALLAELLRRPGAILSRAQLLDRAWHDAGDSGERTIDTHVKTLRGKLRAADAAADPLRTHRGVGYSLDVG